LPLGKKIIKKKAAGMTLSPAGFREERAGLEEVRGWFEPFGAWE